MMINELRYSSWGSKMDNLGSRNSTDMIAMRTKDSSERFGVLSFVQKSTFYKDGLGSAVLQRRGKLSAHPRFTHMTSPRTNQSVIALASTMIG